MISNESKKGLKSISYINNSFSSATLFLSVQNVNKFTQKILSLKAMHKNLNSASKKEFLEKTNM